MRIPRPHAWTAVAGIAAMTLLGGGVAFAATTSSSTTYAGCLNRASGVLYHVQTGTSPAPRCTGHDTVISWNAQGPQGDPGPTGPTGVAGPVGPAGLKGDAGSPGAPGETGPTGEAGPAGPKGDTGNAGANGVLGYDVQSGPVSFPAGQSGKYGVPCPSGDVPISGGATAVTDNTVTTKDISIQIHESYPYAAGNEWFTTVTNTSESTQSVTFYTVCAKQPA